MFAPPVNNSEPSLVSGSGGDGVNGTFVLCLPVTIFGLLSFMCLPWIINYFNDPTVFAKDPTGLATANAIAKTIFQLPLPLVITLQIIAAVVIAIIYFALFTSKWTAYLMSLFLAYFFFSLMKHLHSSDGWAWFMAVWTFVSGVIFHRKINTNTP